MLTFKKNERLCNFHHKERLFSEGKRLYVFPFGVTYLVWPNSETLLLSNGQSTEKASCHSNTAAFANPCKVMITAPKRLFKNATRRNRVRRLVKEAFRKNKLQLYAFLEENNYKCLMSVVYSSPNVLRLGEIEERMTDCLTKLVEVISKNILDNNC